MIAIPIALMEGEVGGPSLYSQLLTNYVSKNSDENVLIKIIR